MSLRDTINNEKAPSTCPEGVFPLSQDWERDRVRVGEAERHGPSSQVITLTPPLSRKPGEGVPSSRTYKGLFGAERTETAEL